MSTKEVLLEVAEKLPPDTYRIIYRVSTTDNSLESYASGMERAGFRGFPRVREK
jgi:hypothetical protein